MDSFTEANNMLAIALLKKLCKEKIENLLFSPPSISFALAMVLLGAKNDTAAQIEQLLSLDRDGDINLGFQSLLTEMNEPITSYMLETTNRVFGENALNFLPSFKESCEKFYSSVLEDLCFSENAEAMRKHINAWVAENTKGKILEAVPENTVNPLTLLIFVNAINFNLKWRTDPVPIKRVLRSHKQGHRMSQIMVNQEMFLGFYIEELGANVCICTYKGMDWNIILVLPVDDGQKMEKELTYETFITWTKPEVLELMEILSKRLFIPKIKIEVSYDMVHILCSLGMSDAFLEDKADFSGLSVLKDFHLLSVFHSSSLEFSDEGIEASAVTVATELPGTAKEEEGFKHHSLFLFFIWSQKIKSILFCGRLCTP
ncbi:serpin B6-like [Trichosurus vulpecula]|uniref:serpin B6-like n=1 Tax=Trichosurus vulpecula TaxID=9337 RepID=UPI00186AF77C|nr:serpin B6-like [Trichosurus vulpecula]